MCKVNIGEERKAVGRERSWREKKDVRRERRRGEKKDERERRLGEEGMNEVSRIVMQSRTSGSYKTDQHNIKFHVCVSKQRVGWLCEI